MKALTAQARVELLLTLRRGESVLLTFAIPVLLLVFFSTVDVLPSEPGVDEPVTFLLPGVLALAVMSTAMVSLSIATGFERSTGVLKRLGATPLGRPRLLAAKGLAVAALQVLQVTVLVGMGLLLGFRFDGASWLAAVAGMVLATVAFGGIGLLMAGSLPALTTLAAANGLYLVLLLLGGMVFPLSRLPGPLETTAQLLPAGALSEILHSSLTGGGVAGSAWLVMAAWAVITPALAVSFFRWE